MTIGSKTARTAGFLIGWVVLIAAVAVTAKETQELVVDQNAVLEQQNVALAQSQTGVCGAWLGTYRFLSAWAESKDVGLSKKTADRVRRGFVRDFNAYCADYVPVGEERP